MPPRPFSGLGSAAPPGCKPRLFPFRPPRGFRNTFLGAVAGGAQQSQQGDDHTVTLVSSPQRDIQAQDGGQEAEPIFKIE